MLTLAVANLTGPVLKSALLQLQTDLTATKTGSFVTVKCFFAANLPPILAAAKTKVVDARLRNSIHILKLF